MKKFIEPKLQEFNMILEPICAGNGTCPLKDSNPDTMPNWGLCKDICTVTKNQFKGSKVCPFGYTESQPV